LEFTSTLVEKVNTPATQDAYVYALVEAASLKLLLGQGEAVRKDLDGAAKILDTFDSVDPVIHAAYYRVNADYYSVSLSLMRLTSRARSIIHNTTITLFFTSLVYLNLPLFRRMKLELVRTISVSLLSLAKRSTTSVNFYYILSSNNSKHLKVLGYETCSLL
jgi:hypothetical protein